jgi:streptogramin lyase
VCAGWLWVQVYSGSDALVQIDPASGEVVGQIEGGTNLACFGGEPWAAVDGTAIQHLNAEGREVLASVAVKTYYAGVGAGSVWVPSGHDVVRIDPETAQIVATIPVHPRYDVTEVDGTDDAVWATVKSAETVYRIDPASNAVIAEVGAGAFAHGILIQPDAVWISNAHENTVTRIDPATNTAVLFVDGPGAGVGLAGGGGYVWASSRRDLYRIDPTTSQAVAVVQMGGWPYGIASADGVLWVTNGSGGSVYGIAIEELVAQ